MGKMRQVGATPAIVELQEEIVGLKKTIKSLKRRITLSRKTLESEVKGARETGERWGKREQRLENAEREKYHPVPFNPRLP